MTLVAKLDGGRIHAGVAMHRATGTGATPVAEQEKLAAILPEITRAMDLGFRHGEKLTEAYWNGLAHGWPEPALLLDDGGRVLRLSDAMAALLAHPDGLDIAGGRPRAGDAAAEARMAAAIRRSLAAEGPRSGATRVPRPSGRAPYVVTLYPLPRTGRLLPPSEAAALMTVVDPAAPPARADLHRQAFGLTSREAELAALLQAGHSIGSAAAVLEIAMPTARTHLRRLLEKAGVSRQIDLVRLLARVG